MTHAREKRRNKYQIGDLSKLLKKNMAKAISAAMARQKSEASSKKHGENPSDDLQRKARKRHIMA